MESKFILQLKSITKLYPGVVALDDISIAFKEGEIHALVGENGAGKSTIIKIITGAITPTKGSIFYNNSEIKYLNTAKTLDMGISAIYQEFNLIPYLTVAENIFYGREIRRGIFVNYKQMEKKSKEILSNLGISINPKRMLKELSVGYQQIVEIAKSISRDTKVLIMDEPSAPLTNREIKYMFTIVKKLKERGVTIIYISHRLEEVFELSDRVTVMRDGKYVATLNTKDTNRKEIISLMVGRELGNDYPEKNVKTGNKILELKNISTKNVKNISFNLKSGEILGLAGIVGAGRTEVARAIFGADNILEGDIFINGKKVRIKSPSQAIKNGIGLIPEDRKQQGVLLRMSVRDNISYSSLNKLSKYGLINRKKEKISIEKICTDLKIKTPTLDQLVKNLSGGNQQKVVLAKWLLMDSKILIFDEPTRGIDVGAKQEIYNIMKELIEAGKSIIMISSEMPELLGMSDRILVMHEGRIAGELNKQEATQEIILSMASGTSKGE